LDTDDESPLSEVVGSTILGSEGFVKEIKNRFIEGKKVSRDLPALNSLSSKPAIEDIIKAVASEFTQHPAMIKNIAIYICHRYSGSKLKQIGRHFNIGESAVSQASRRMGIKIEQDKKLGKQIKKIENRFNLSKV